MHNNDSLAGAADAVVLEVLNAVVDDGMGVVEGQVRDVPFLERGEIDGAGQPVPRGFPRLLSSGSIPPDFDGGSGRLELARWITGDDHPLTARVWANRIWLHLFGRGIVTTPDNFGLSGRTPTHPGLLDHLATRLVALDWSTKSVIREIVLSKTYRLDSSPRNGETVMANEDIDVLTHGIMPHRRLEAEAIRDSMLQVAGELDAGQPTGSAVGVLEGIFGAGQIDRALGASRDRFIDRRSIYLPIVRNAIPDSLAVFDFPEPEFVSGSRDQTNVATQALYLMNADRVQELARSFAVRILESAESPQDRFSLLFQLAYGRDPSSYQVRACRDFLRRINGDHLEDREHMTKDETPRERRQRMARSRRARGGDAVTQGSDSTDPEIVAWSSLCQTIFQTSEFRTLD